MKAFTFLFLAAALCFGLAVSEALAQQPTEEQRIADQAAARIRVMAAFMSVPQARDDHHIGIRPRCCEAGGATEVGDRHAGR